MEICLEDMQNIVEGYFKNIFSTSNPSNVHAFSAGLPSRVDADLNRDLIRPVTQDKVWRAVFAINPSKAPGEDGLTGFFFQKY